jgi:hypothetical protein
MSEAELLELSLRARRYRSAHGKRRMGQTTAVYFDRFRISDTFEAIVSVNRVGHVFFRHWYDSPKDEGKRGQFECTNDEWAKELLIKLRTAQVLDTLANI